MTTPEAVGAGVDLTLDRDAAGQGTGAAVAEGAPSVAAGGAPTVAVIIPHYEDPERLARCLEALAREDLSGVEVAVVDNASPTAPPPEALKAAHPHVRFLVEAEKGAAAARNRGVAETAAPNLLFIDSDCVPCPGWIAAARRAIGAAPLVGGHVGTFDETPPPRSGAEAFEAVFAFDFQDYIERKGFSGAGNLLTTRAVFDAVGGFRGGVSEDREWTRRAVAAGHPLIYRAEMAVVHPTRQDWGALERKWRRMTSEMWELHREDAGGGARARLLWAGRALLMPASVLAHLPRVMGSDRLASGAERRRAAATLLRLRIARMGWMLRQAAAPVRRGS